VADRINVALVALVCLGVWLHAADALVATTVMPSAVAEIGGLSYIYWTIALYELGSIIAGAVTGVAVVALGFRSAMTASAFTYAIGCAASALAPSMAVMLVGRLVQGLGGGAMLALSYVGVSLLFPERLWTRVLAIVSGVWGVSSLVGPFVGGVFASAGLWRGAFWVFGAQALVLVALTPMLVGARGDFATGRERRSRAPDRRADVRRPRALARRRADGRARHGRPRRRRPRRPRARPPSRERRAHPAPPTDAAQLPGPLGAGYAMVLALATATVSFTVYGPLLMTRLFHVSPLTAGLMVATESIAWTLAAIAFARAGPAHEPALIRGGALLVTAGIVAFAATMPRGAGRGAHPRRAPPGCRLRDVLGVRPAPHRRQRGRRRARAGLGRDADAADDRLCDRRSGERHRRERARADGGSARERRPLRRLLGVRGVSTPGAVRRGGGVQDGPGPETHPAS
jgi:MFS family permease